jgi:hypothetical protein
LSNQPGTSGKFTAEDVRLMLSSPAYSYGINLLPADKVAEAVMQLNTRLAEEMRASKKRFTLQELDEKFLALLKELEESGDFRRGQDHPPIVPKETWLQAQRRYVNR